MMSVMIGSRPVFGSSKSRISGSCAIARAKPTRRRMPPESSEGRFSSTLGRWTISRHSRTRSRTSRRRAARAAQRKGDVVEDRHRIEERPLLEGHAELLAHRGCARRVESAQKSSPSTKTLPESGRISPIRCFEQHALAGAGRAHDDERLALRRPRRTSRRGRPCSPKDLRRSSRAELRSRAPEGAVERERRARQKRSFVRKKSATRIDEAAGDDGARRRAADPLRAARRCSSRARRRRARRSGRRRPP